MLARSPAIAAVVGERPVFYSRLLPLKGGVVLGWGRKWSGRRATALAARSDKEFCLMEDGFLRSVGRYDPTLSVVMDRIGIHYDARMASDLERLAKEELSEAEIARSRAVMELWRSKRLSKYNAARDFHGDLPDRYILVCDQTFGDASIAYGAADGASFARMLEAALQEYPDHKILLKTHPDVLTSGKKGYFDFSAFRGNHRVRIISDPMHPVRLLEHADAVYTVTSQLGFEALLWGKRVRCFGMPFYAGWGLTEDALLPPDRRRPILLEQLIYAALVKYPRYIEPLSSQLCEPERAFSHVGLQRQRRSEFPQRIAAIGFSRWKCPFVEKFLQGSDVAFAERFTADPAAYDAEALAVWGCAKVPDSFASKPVLRLEDGFLRSSGLGVDLVRPLSLVVDDVGLYFDATRPSRLENILEAQELGVGDLERARAIRERIIQLDLTKYNLGRRSWSRPSTDKPVLLVVGQVETDASIRLGSPELRSNMDLLRRVRRENPGAYIVYKPHPDVIAGLRRKGSQEEVAREFADEVLTDPVSAGGLLAQGDVVHTMTSLMGFEALLRGCKVVCHGLPFYAGWGLTEDRLRCDRRQRKVSLDELVYAALVTYPRYFNYEANCFVEPEEAVKQLAALAEHGPKMRSRSRKLLRAAILTWLKLTGSRR